MWVVGKRKTDGGVTILPESEITAMTQAPGAEAMVIFVRGPEGREDEQVFVTQISVHASLANAVLEMVKICHPKAGD